MLDTTYKTNRFKMPLFNICGISQQRQPFQIASVFLEGESEARFTWAFNALDDYLSENKLKRPRCIITDRDLGVINALKHHLSFKSIPRLLCRWHINMNVLAKTTPFFPKATRRHGLDPERHPTFLAFLEAWNGLVQAPTLTQFDELLAKLQGSTNGALNYPPDADAYVTNTWVPYKHQFMRCFINNVLHFGHISVTVLTWTTPPTSHVTSLY
ncbi:transposase, partial [Candidatus Bathyarchaeota archaeon]|nr:transposase [Candidatus Bathyarchaeota archaeon]